MHPRPPIFGLIITFRYGSPTNRQRRKKRYYFEIDGLKPRIEYIKAKEKIVLTHTEVPKALEGKGVAFALVKAVLEEVDKQGLVLAPLCPFVAMYIKRHPKWNNDATWQMYGSEGLFF